MNLPAVTPECALVHVTVMPLFEPGEARRRFTVSHGSTVSDIIAKALPCASPSVLSRVRISLVKKAGFYPINSNVWHVVRPNADVHVVIRVVPAGSAMQSVLQLLVTVAATAITGPLGLNLLGFFRTLATFAIVTAGGLLLNALFRPEQPGEDKEKPTYSISSWRNQASPDGFVPLVAGKIRYAPKYAASTWAEVVGDLIYIRSAFLWGYGPLAVSDLKIGETPIAKFDEVTIETQYGASGDALFTLYQTQIIEESIGAEVVLEPPFDDYGEPTDDPPEEKPVSRFTATDASEACIIFYFEGGLFDTDDKGKQGAGQIEIELATRLVGAPDFDVVTTLRYDEEITKSFFRSYRWTLKNHAGLATRGRYEVRLTRKTKNDQNVGDQDDLKWFALQSFRPESPFNFPKAHAKSLVRVKATNQLNGTLDALNGVVSAKMRNWNGTSWVANMETRNPASFSLQAITGPHLAYPAPDSEIDWPAFEDWHEHCAATDLKYDRVHDFENGLGDVLAASGAAGRAAVWHDGEKWTVTIDRPREVIDDHISPRNASNFRWSTKYFDPPDAHRVTFLDETNDYLEAERIVPWPADVRYASKALMNADLGHRAKIRAEVYADPDPANNGYYRKTGVKGAGSWVPKPIEITEALELPGKTDPDEIWIETRRLQYERIYRNTIYSATQAGSVRRAAPGSAVMLARDVLVRAMHSGRVTAVVGNRIETDAVFRMEAGKNYGLRFRSYGNDEDGFGISVLRTLRTVAGDNRAVTLTGEGAIPTIGDLVHFGPVAQESIPAIVAGIERGNDNTSILQMLPAADEMHAKVAAEVPPAWSGRVGSNLSGSNAAPPVPVVTAVRSGITGTGTANGLFVRLRPGTNSPVIVDTFEIRHRLFGAGAWATPAAAPAAGGVIIVPGYVAGNAVEWQPRSLSKDGIPSAWGTSRTTTIGSADPLSPGALNSGLIVATGGLGKSDIFFTVAPTEANITHVQLFSNTSGTLNPVTDAILSPIAVEPGGTYTRVHGDPSITTLVTNGSFSAPASPPALGSNWIITGGHADHSAGAAGSISWAVAMSNGDDIRLSFNINSVSGGTLTPRSTGTATETWATAYTTPGLKLQSHVATSANTTLELLAASTAVSQIDDVAAYKKTPASLSQGNQFYWLRPFNGVTPGPLAGPFLAIIR